MQELVDRGDAFLKSDGTFPIVSDEDRKDRGADLACLQVQHPGITTDLLMFHQPNAAFRDWAIEWLGVVVEAMLDAGFVSKCNHLMSTQLNSLLWVARNAQVRLLQIDPRFKRGIDAAFVDCLALLEDLKHVMKLLHEHDKENIRRDRLVKSATKV